MKSSVYKLIILSIFRKKKFPVLIFLIAFIVSFMVSSQMISYYNNWKSNVNDFEQIYGEYQFGISDLSRQQMNILVNNLPVSSSAVYYEKIINIDNQNFVHLYTAPNYVTLSNIELLDGTFPESEEEILCESWFLVQNNFSLNDCIGKKINVNGNEYTISGIIIDHWAQSIEGAYITTIVHNDSFIKDDDSKYGIICTYKKGNLDNILNIVEDELGHNYIDNWFENSLLFFAADMNIDKCPTGEEFHIFCICISLYLLIASLLVTLLSLVWLKSLKKNEIIYTKIAIPTHIIKKSKTISLGLTLLTSMFFGSFISNILFNKMNLKVALFIQFIFFSTACLITVFCYLISDKKYKKKLSHSFSLTKMYIRQPSFNRVCYRLALRNICNSFSKVLIIELALILGFLTFSLGGHALTIIKEANTSPLTYNYQINFQVDYNKIDLVQSSYERLKNDSNLELTSLYFTMSNIKIEKGDLSEKYLANLSKIDPEINTLLQNPSIDTIKFPLTIIGVDNKIAQDFGIDVDLLKENNCIIALTHNSLPNPGINFGTQIYLEMPGQSEKLNVNGIKNMKLDEFGFQSYLPVVLINIDKYQSIFASYFPTVCYCNIKGDNNIEETLFKGNPFIQVIDMKENNNILNEHYNKSQKMLNRFIFLLSVTSLLSVFITIYSQYYSDKENYDLLITIGIPKKYIYKIFIYELFTIVTFVILCSVLISATGSYLISYLINRNLYYVSYSIPIRYIAIAVLCLIGGAIVNSALLLQKIYKGEKTI